MNKKTKKQMYLMSDTKQTIQLTQIKDVDSKLNVLLALWGRARRGFILRAFIFFSGGLLIKTQTGFHLGRNSINWKEIDNTPEINYIASHDKVTAVL